MQRTVKTTRVTYARTERNDEGIYETKIATVDVMDTDPKKVQKAILKNLGMVQVIATEVVEELWVLDDDTFFKYAHPVKPKEKA